MEITFLDAFSLEVAEQYKQPLVHLFQQMYCLCL